MTEKQKAQQISRPLFKSAPALFSAFNTSSLLHASDVSWVNRTGKARVLVLSQTGNRETRSREQ